MRGWPQRVVIVGGGTAGWLAALMIGDAARRGRRTSSVTVIESSRIGTIGVGEGTTAVFRQMLQHLGIDEMQFLRETDATIKFGIRHRDWRRVGHEYDGPIDDPHLVAGGTKGSTFLDAYQVAHGRPVGETHLFGHLMARRRSPFGSRAGRRVALGPYHHAYHFDQARVGAFLRRRAEGVSVIDDQVSGVLRDGETGDITALSLEGGGEIAGDLFVDCTGFRRRLITEMGATWTSYAGILPVNRAMPFWLDIAPGEEIDPFTLAWAQGSGWMWKIPTATRYGCGYVYSDAHIDPAAAQAEIEAALRRPIEPRNDIRIDAGRLSANWIGNCVALGLSSSFLEPLEATSIHGTVVQLMLLTALLSAPSPRNPARYNAAVARQVDDFRDFIRLHYVSERRDTQFWQDLATTHPAELTARLAMWRVKLPDPRDFAEFPLGLPHVGHQLHMPVLDGLGLLRPEAAKAALAARPKLRAHARRKAAELIREYRMAAGKAESHRHFLSTLTEDIAA
jgi:2-polyprenyl-6-methoxyphenol hydroxylase-like FAD-dependent oxidoreductase